MWARVEESLVENVGEEGKGEKKRSERRERWWISPFLNDRY